MYKSNKCESKIAPTRPAQQIHAREQKKTEKERTMAALGINYIVICDIEIDALEKVTIGDEN